MAAFYLSFFTISFYLLQSFSGTQSTTFTITNKCTYTVYPGLLSGAGTPPLTTTGFSLSPDQSTTLPIPPSWSGRIWGRTLCSTDPTTNKFTCQTGDCNSGTTECSGSGATPPATLAEFTLNGANGQDFYDVSLVDGFNLPMIITPVGGTNCTTTGCVTDLNNACPSDLKVTESINGQDVACKSACEAFGDPKYCCSGEFGSPETCKPSDYSMFFKSACPKAYSYAYDDGTSTFTCAGADYTITFCPTSPTNSLKSANSGPNPEGVKITSGSSRVNPTTFLFFISLFATRRLLL